MLNTPPVAYCIHTARVLITPAVEYLALPGIYVYALIVSRKNVTRFPCVQRKHTHQCVRWMVGGIGVITLVGGCYPLTYKSRVAM